MRSSRPFGDGRARFRVVRLRLASHRAAHAAHAAHAAAHAAGATLVVALVGGEVTRGDDVVDFEDQVRGLGGATYRLLFGVRRLDDTHVEGVLQVARQDVQAGAGLAALVGRAEVDERIDRVEAGVLGEHARDEFEAVSKRLDGELLAAGDGVRVAAQPVGDRDFDCAAAGEDAAVGDGLGRDVERVRDAAFELVDDVVGRASEDERDAVGFLVEALDVEQLVLGVAPDAPSPEVVGGERVEVAVADVEEKTRGFLDVGSDTVDAYAPVIRDSDAVFVKGALGLFEDERFSKGTVGVLETIAETDCFSVVGGGDTSRAIGMYGMREEDFSHVSIAGGAYIRALTGDPLPAVEVLRR